MISIEICCGSADDVVQAKRGGAHRAELNSALFLGGLTPSPGELKTAKAHADIPLMCMLRPRAGGFCYTDLEFETIMADADILLEAGADGLVFGFLHQDGTVDAARCEALMKRAAGKDTVFHRAIDVVPNWREALDILIGLGVTRVLSSGQRPDSFWGAPVLAEMIDYAAGRIEILPGGGVTMENATQIVEKTGCTQLHLALGKEQLDCSTRQNTAIYFGGALYPPEDKFTITDNEAVAEFIKKL